METLEQISANWELLTGALGVVLASVLAVWRSFVRAHNDEKEGDKPGGEKRKPWPPARGLVMLIGLGCSGLGCGGAVHEYVPIVARTLDTFVETAKALGVDPDRGHVRCEHELTPDERKLLVMCEADLPER